MRTKPHRPSRHTLSFSPTPRAAVIFAPELIPLIQRGRKTQTRERVKGGETECRWRPGRSYAVQAAAGKREVARVTVVSTRIERLADLTPDDARAEGFKTEWAFNAHWRRLNGDFDQATRVWVITFSRIVNQPPRFLVSHAQRQMTRTGLRDYTDRRDQAMRGEPEVVDEHTAARFARASHERDAALKLADRGPLEQRWADLAAEARRRGIDITRLEASLERRVNALDRRLRAG